MRQSRPGEQFPERYGAPITSEVSGLPRMPIPEPLKDAGDCSGLAFQAASESLLPSLGLVYQGHHVCDLQMPPWETRRVRVFDDETPYHSPMVTASSHIRLLLSKSPKTGHMPFSTTFPRVWSATHRLPARTCRLLLVVGDLCLLCHSYGFPLRRPFSRIPSCFSWSSVLRCRAAPLARVRQVLFLPLSVGMACCSKFLPAHGPGKCPRV